jgi:hypothetical protein
MRPGQNPFAAKPYMSHRVRIARVHVHEPTRQERVDDIDRIKVEPGQHRICQDTLSDRQIDRMTRRHKIWENLDKTQEDNVRHYITRSHHVYIHI